jgi:hypothetical protein
MKETVQDKAAAVPSIQKTSVLRLHHTLRNPTSRYCCDAKDADHMHILCSEKRERGPSMAGARTYNSEETPLNTFLLYVVFVGPVVQPWPQTCH